MNTKIYLALCIIGSLLCSPLIIHTVTYDATAKTSNGPYPGAPAYTVWCDSEGCYAKNGYNDIVYSDVEASTVIQNVINATKTWGGGTIFLKEGHYTLSQPLVYSLYGGEHYIQIKGSGKMGATTLDGETLNDYAVQLVDSVGLGLIQISDLMIKGGVRVVNGSNYEFNNVRFADSGQNRWNLYVSDVSMMKVTYCHLSVGDAGNMKIDSISMPSNDIVISHNEVYGANNELLLMCGPPNNPVRDVTVSNNCFEAYATRPANAINLWNTRWTTIMGNTIAGRTGINKDLIKIQQGSTQICITANRIWALSGTENRYAINVMNSTKISIIGNPIIYGQNRAVVLDRDSSQCIVSYNTEIGSVLNGPIVDDGTDNYVAYNWVNNVWMNVTSSP